MIIRALLVKLRRHLSSSSANQHPHSSTNQTQHPTGVWWRCGGYTIYTSICPPSSPPHIFLSLFLSYNTSFFRTAALIFLCGRQRILKATITAQNYQFPLQLTLWEERGTRERKERAKMGMRDSNSVQGAVMCFGLRRERITPPRDELDPATGGQTSNYTAKAPYPHYQQIGLASVPLMQTVC